MNTNDRKDEIKINETLLKVSSTSSRRLINDVVCFHCDKKEHFRQNSEDYQGYKEWSEKNQSRDVMEK